MDFCHSAIKFVFHYNFANYICLPFFRMRIIFLCSLPKFSRNNKSIYGIVARCLLFIAVQIQFNQLQTTNAQSCCNPLPTCSANGDWGDWSAWRWEFLTAESLHLNSWILWAWKRISQNLRNSQNYQKCYNFSENFKIQLQTFRHKKI